MDSTLYFAYGGYGAAPTDIAGQAAETLSLVLIVLSLLVVAFLSYRVKTVKSFQFEMFIFVLVLLLAEVPRILDTLGFIQTASVEGVGLLLHTASMIFLAGFIMIRVFRFFKEGK